MMMISMSTLASRSMQFLQREAQGHASSGRDSAMVAGHV